VIPNHFHSIISIDYKINDKDNREYGKIPFSFSDHGAIIKGFKGATTKKINNLIRGMRKNSGS